MGYIDAIGDIHSCVYELYELLEKLKYKKENDLYIPPKDHILIATGDLFGRGKYTIETYNFVKNMKDKGYMLSVIGNHDEKLLRYFKGNKVQLLNGDDISVKDFIEANCNKEEVFNFLSFLPFYIKIDNFIVAHAYSDEKIISRDPFDKRSRTLSIYGLVKEVINGMPVRIDWATNRIIDNNSPTIIYGHSANKEVKIINKTYGIDTGCVFGNKLTCLRIPTMEIVSINSKKYAEKKFWI